ncbi:hypothetical protein ACFLS8_00805 [Chloroflexota bacterium]
MIIDVKSGDVVERVRINSKTEMKREYIPNIVKWASSDCSPETVKACSSFCEDWFEGMTYIAMMGEAMAYCEGYEDAMVKR